MSNYFSVIKLLIKNMFKKSGKEKKGLFIFSAVMLGILYVSIAALIIFVIVGASSAIVQFNLQSEVLTIIFAICCVFILILGIVGILNTLYFSRDSEFFLSLPIKNSTVYFAKMTVVYLTELVIEALILIPCLLTMGIMLHMSAVFYIVGIAAILTLPFLPIMIGSILAIPLMYIVSFFRKKGALTSVVLILLFGLFFAGYYFVLIKFSNSMGSGEAIDINQLISQFKDAFVTVSNILLPLSSLAKLATLTPVFGLGVGVSSVVNLAIYTAFIAVLIVLAYFVSNTVYKKGVAAMLEGARSQKVDAKEYKASGSALKALIMKEWRQLVRTPAFAFQCLFSLVLTPVVVAVLSLSSTTMEVKPEEVEIMNMIYSYIGICVIMMMGVGMNQGAATSITREGETFYYNKVLPVDYKEQIKAKKILYMILSYAVIIVSFILSMILTRSFWVQLIGIGFILFYNYAYINFLLLFDLHSPRLKWTTPNEAVKNNKSAIVPMFINMGISIVLMIIITFALVSPIFMIIVWIALYAISITLAIVLHKVLNKKAVKYYERIEL